MLALYLICLAIGGVLVGVSVFAGGHTDSDADADADADHEGDSDHDHDSGVLDGLSTVLPIASLRFWTFLLAFGGLTGVLFTLLDLAGPIGTGIAAGAVGWVTGFGITQVIRRLKSGQVSSTISSGDCVGATGTLMLPVSREHPGRVRVELKGQVIDFIAETDDGSELAIEEKVLVYDVRDDGTAIVERIAPIARDE